MSNEVRLRNVDPNDLPIFYEQQLDADATRMAAFAARDRAALPASLRDSRGFWRRPGSQD